MALSSALHAVSATDVVLVLRLTNVSSGQKMTTPRSRLFTSRAKDVIFDQTVQATLTKWAVYQ